MKSKGLRKVEMIFEVFCLGIGKVKVVPEEENKWVLKRVRFNLGHSKCEYISRTS